LSTEFKQIIGRGTRVRDEYGKLSFGILDYTGSATRLFADPEFDGDPALITEEEIDDTGATVQDTYHLVEPHPSPGAEEREQYIVTPELTDDSEGAPRKYYYDGGQAQIVTEIISDLDPQGRLRAIKVIDHTASSVRAITSSGADIRKRWSDPQQRTEIIRLLRERGIDFEELAAATNQPDADPFDLLCYVAYNAPLRTRRERADRLRQEEQVFFEHYGPEARGVLNDLLEKYAEHGTTQFTIPDVLKVPPISERGNVSEIVRFFGGADRLREAVTQLQTLLYAA
ncbi:MAG TPA: type I restriction-modification enzyme R subunit C-terminal domain-containing protein, partial [Roseiflexaceae bacterium]